MGLKQSYTNIAGYFNNNPGAKYSFGGGACFIGATLTGISVTPFAVKLVNEYKSKKDKNKKDFAILFGKLSLIYTPTIALTILGCNNLDKSCKTYEKQIAAATTAYMITDKAYREYKDKIKEKLSEKKEKQVHDEIVQKNLNEAENPEDSGKEISVIDNGELLCEIAKTKRFFRATPETVYKVEKELSDRFSQTKGETWVSFNDMYDMLGMDRDDLGDYLGWDVDSGIEWSYSYCIRGNNEKCLVIDFDFRIDPLIKNIGGYSEYAYM